jgi:hypothetical protein
VALKAKDIDSLPQRRRLIAVDFALIFAFASIASPRLLHFPNFFGEHQESPLKRCKIATRDRIRSNKHQ